jgi:hypothetical protein
LTEGDQTLFTINNSLGFEEFEEPIKIDTNGCTDIYDLLYEGRWAAVKAKSKTNKNFKIMFEINLDLTLKSENPEDVAYLSVAEGQSLTGIDNTKIVIIGGFSNSTHLTQEKVLILNTKNAKLSKKIPFYTKKIPITCNPFP